MAGWAITAGLLAQCRFTCTGSTPTDELSVQVRASTQTPAPTSVLVWRGAPGSARCWGGQTAAAAPPPPPRCGCSPPPVFVHAGRGSRQEGTGALSAVIALELLGAAALGALCLPDSWSRCSLRCSVRLLPGIAPQPAQPASRHQRTGRQAAAREGAHLARMGAAAAGHRHLHQRRQNAQRQLSAGRKGRGLAAVCSTS